MEVAELALMGPPCWTCPARSYQFGHVCPYQGLPWSISTRTAAVAPLKQLMEYKGASQPHCSRGSSACAGWGMSCKGAPGCHDVHYWQGR